MSHIDPVYAHSHPSFQKSILILPSPLRLVLPSGLFPSGFPTKALYTPILSSPTYMPRVLRKTTHTYINM